MIIRQTRVRSLKKYFKFLPEGSSFILGVRLDKNFDLEKIGFLKKVSVGDTILPYASIGPVSRFNAEGKYLKQKDKGMETAYMQREWHWKEFHGPYERVERSKIVDVPYKRYPRKFISPPSLELSFVRTNKINIVKINYVFKYKKENEEIILHGINLLLEIFKECEIFTEDLQTISPSKIRRLNWEVLPQGKYPWKQLKPKVSEIIKSKPAGNRPVIENRIEKISKYSPEFIAIGRAGFRGYLIFGFPEKNLYVLESTEYGNATYVLSQKWEELSKLTKSQILNNELHEKRIIHREFWENEIDKLLA